MAERRIRPLLAIEAGAVSCGRCMYLENTGRFYRCRLFTGLLEEGNRGPHRADECLMSEERAAKLEAKP